MIIFNHALLTPLSKITSHHTSGRFLPRHPSCFSHVRSVMYYNIKRIITTVYIIDVLSENEMEKTGVFTMYRHTLLPVEVSLYISKGKYFRSNFTN